MTSRPWRSAVTKAHPNDRVIWLPTPEPEETRMSDENLPAEAADAIDVDNAPAKV